MNKKEVILAEIENLTQMQEETKEYIETDAKIRSLLTQLYYLEENEYIKPVKK